MSLYNLTQNVVLNYSGVERKRTERLQFLHEPLGFNFWTAECRQIEHLLPHNSPHAVLKIIVNFINHSPNLSITAFGMLYIMGIYIIQSTQKTLKATQSMKTICICSMSAPLEWEIIHIMWLQAPVLLWRVKCCDPDQAHQCWCPHDYKWALNTLVFFSLLSSHLMEKITNIWKSSPGREK